MLSGDTRALDYLVWTRAYDYTKGTQEQPRRLTYPLYSTLGARDPVPAIVALYSNRTCREQPEQLPHIKIEHQVKIR